MPRGNDAKLRRRNRKKEEEEHDEDAFVTDMFGPAGGGGGFTEQVPLPPSLSDAPLPKKKKKTKKTVNDDDIPYIPAAKKGIKSGPLILLFVLTGTTLLPALIFAGDYLSAFMGQNDIMGSIGFRLGIGAVPKKRVMSFYEKHAPEKVPDVPKILAKHYGDYPKLIKKLERKYQDYGYFMGWQDDESPTRLFKDYMSDVYKVWMKIWNRFAPQVAKTAARNARYNLSTVYKKGRKIWKKTVWPMLEPIFGVPDGAEKQKRQDAAEARKRRAAGTSSSNSGRRKKNRDYRDDVED